MYDYLNTYGHIKLNINSDQVPKLNNTINYNIKQQSYSYHSSPICSAIFNDHSKSERRSSMASRPTEIRISPGDNPVARSYSSFRPE